MNKRLTFYFDYLSPYAFLAWRKVRELPQNYSVDINPQPVLFGALLTHWGSLGPAEIPPKRRFTFTDILRWAEYYQLNLHWPLAHPFNPLPALRATCLMEGVQGYQEFISRIFDACWIEGIDITLSEFLDALLLEFGIENGLEKSVEPVNKQRLKEKTAQAINSEVFGVPSMLVDQELFWGHDQMGFIEKYLKDGASLDQALLNDVLSRPAAIQRKR